MLNELEEDFDAGADDNKVLGDLRPKVQAAVEINIIRSSSAQLMEEANHKKDLLAESKRCDSYLEPDHFVQVQNLIKI